jgi:hypothetical protein
VRLTTVFGTLRGFQASVGRLATASLALLALSALVGAGCGPACNGDNVCAVGGHPPDVQVCDGNDFRTCGAGNRGQTIACGKSARRAVCSLDGWTFENASLPDGG